MESPKTETAAEILTRLMIDTLRLSALTPEDVEIARMSQIGTRVLRIELTCHPEDTPLLIGGGGRNIQGINRLGAFARDDGQTLEIAIAETMDRAGHFERLRPLIREEPVAEVNDAWVDVLTRWVEIMGLAPRDFEVSVESGTLADVFVVPTTSMPAEMTKELRKLLRWSLHLQGRIGCLEFDGRAQEA